MLLFDRVQRETVIALSPVVADSVVSFDQDARYTHLLEACRDLYADLTAADFVTVSAKSWAN